MPDTLTKTTVTNAQAKSERYDLFDKKLKGFGVRITPNGTKTFFVSYRAGDGGRLAQKRRYTIGKFGAFTVDEARTAAQCILADIRLGADPVTARAKRRATITVQQLAVRFVDEHVKRKRKPSTAALYEDILNRIVVPEIGNMKVDAVSQADLVRLHGAWSATPYQANRMLAVVASMYGVAAKIGEVAEGFNPAKRIEKFKESGRERFLSKDELERLLLTIDRAEVDGLEWKTNDAAPGAKHLPADPRNRRTRLNKYAAAAIRLLIFTGARLREILHLRWSDVDVERGMLHLSDSKTGRKPIFLNDAAKSVLNKLPRSGDYVIAGDDPKKPRTDLKRPWSVISRAAEIEGVRIHDLRHTYASIAASNGVSLAVIGKLLGHSNTRTTEKYAHLTDDHARRATNEIGNSIAPAAGGREYAPANNDEPMSSRQRTDERV